MPHRSSARSALPALALLLGCAPAAGEQVARTGAAGPVILELFTSQGCSSCPPADLVLARLVQDGHVGERAVVPLAFHVDYWDDLGWADPFSRAEWSERQRAYAAGFADDRVYTPQLVVDGRGAVLGSNLPAIRARVAATAAPALLAATATWGPRTATVSATAPADADVWVALYEDDVATTIARGENAGTHVTDQHIVRRLARVATADRAGTIELDLDPTWRRLGAVAFAQGADHVIVASRTLDVRP